MGGAASIAHLARNARRALCASGVTGSISTFSSTRANARPFSTWGGLAEDLQALLGVRLDVVTSNALHRRIRKRLLDEAKPV